MFSADANYQCALSQQSQHDTTQAARIHKKVARHHQVLAVSHLQSSRRITWPSPRVISENRQAVEALEIDHVISKILHVRAAVESVSLDENIVVMVTVYARPILLLVVVHAVMFLNELEFLDEFFQEWNPGYCEASQLMCFKSRSNILIVTLRYPGSGLRVRVPPFCLQIFADVSRFTRNFYQFSRASSWSTRKKTNGYYYRGQEEMEKRVSVCTTFKTYFIYKGAICFAD